jgi:probable rRNA maturation factor
MREIDVNDLQSHLADMTETVRSTLEHVLAREGVEACDLSIALVDDARIRELNRQYLNHDYATDVLSFRLDDGADGCLAGEVVVSAERACAEADARGISPSSELLLYVVHGCLHLVGYDDQESGDFEAMHRREAELLAELGIDVAVEP